MANKHDQTCPVAAFLNIFGDSWTLMVIREAFYGAKRFSEIQRNTGIAKNLLSDRLSMLVDEGILYRKEIGERGSRQAYELTEKGVSLVPVIVAIVQWSNEHLFESHKEPLFLVERGTRNPLPHMVPTTAEGNQIEWGNILSQPGPGADKAARSRIIRSERGAR